MLWILRVCGILLVIVFTICLVDVCIVFTIAINKDIKDERRKNHVANNDRKESKKGNNGNAEQDRRL